MRTSREIGSVCFDMENFYGFSCRGIRASYSFSFLEVVVGCEITENESTSALTTNDINRKGKKTIYLHLKKFFRGTRFTFQPFLKSLEGKHKEGEIVCVSGKVSFFGVLYCCAAFFLLVRTFCYAAYFVLRCGWVSLELSSHYASSSSS